MTTRLRALETVEVGDLIYGIGDVGRTDLLLVYSADPASFYARNVPNQATYKFDRDGNGRRIEDGRACAIVSTATLPSEQYQVAIGLDRRMGSNPEYPDTRLTEDEIQLLLTHAKFFEAHLLPGTETLVRQSQKRRAVGNYLTLEWDPFHAQENPASLFEYDDYVPALVDLLDKNSSEDDVAHFLVEIAGLRNRPPSVLEQTDAAATGLIQLRQDWL